MNDRIYIAPVKFSNITILKKIIEELQKSFSIKVEILDLDLDLTPSFSPNRSQYYSTQIIADAISITSDIDGRILILTDVDLFIPVLTFVFGEAQLNGSYSIVSVCRLHEEFYSGIGNEVLLIQRTLKEILHELGHNFGLKHCHDWDCVMHASPGIEEVDIKGESLCSKCSVSVPGYKKYVRY